MYFTFRNGLLVAVLMAFCAVSASAQSSSSTASTSSKDEKAKKWYDLISLRGYMQLRYNRLLETNPDLNCEQCDRFWGDNNGFGIRRARLIFSGNVHDRVFIYIQPDLASAPSTTTLHYAQLRDAYMDLALDSAKTFRLRFGQSKVPYGFENMQSSQNRLPLDRNDALNSAVPNERDLGVFFYWAPAKIRERFSYLVSSGLKGSGDYGVFAFGVYNGQTANRPEVNNNLHMVGRLTYPFKLKEKLIIEPGIQAYTGKTTLLSVTADSLAVSDKTYDDQRVAATLVMYPQPFGFAAEYNWGTGPQYNPETNRIEQKPLQGGFAQVMYMTKVGKQTLIPFVRYQHYNGGKKAELDARAYEVDETEVGLEWQPIRNFELVAMYTMSHRITSDAKKKNNDQQGNLLRLQAQFNF